KDNGWYHHGQRKVTLGGTQAAPNPGVVIYAFTGAMVNGSGTSPSPAGSPPCPDGSCCRQSPSPDTLPSSGDWEKTSDVGGPACMDGGEPVKLNTGDFVHSEIDLALPDVIPLALTRTYRSQGFGSRLYGTPFGAGWTHAYE